ncbi:MAG: ribonuclease P [Nanoarchaeota archaeon]
MKKKQLIKGQQRQFVLQNVRALFQQAAEEFAQDKALANRSVSLARTIAMKVRFRIPKEYKRRFCQHCYRYLQPGVNSRVRVRKGKVIIACLECKKFRRVPVR